MTTDFQPFTLELRFDGEDDDDTPSDVDRTTNRETLAGRFWEFHAANPNVYALLVCYARQAKRAGRGKLGIKCLFERARWYASFETEGDTFKLNNNHAPFYARLIEHNEPDLRGLFETRQQKSISI